MGRAGIRGPRLPSDSGAGLHDWHGWGYICGRTTRNSVWKMVWVAREFVEERQVAAVCAALEPYEWRSFAPPMLARCVLGALDRHRVLDLIAGVPGAAIADPAPVEPAERGDVRVEVLVDFLTHHRWRTLTLAAVGGHLLNELDRWCRQRQRLDAELRELLDDA
jgi:hypothetical protein